MTAPSAKRTAATVNPSFLKMFLTLSLSDAASSSFSLLFSRASICSLFSVILSRALSLSGGCSFSLLAIISSSRMDFCSWEFLLISFLCNQYFTLWTESIFYFFREFWIQPLFSCSFFKGKQRISFLAKTKFLHLQLSCFAKKCLKSRGLCLGKNPSKRFPCFFI